jgi:hypothetical protein
MSLPSDVMPTTRARVDRLRADPSSEPCLLRKACPVCARFDRDTVAFSVLPAPVELLAVSGSGAMLA